MPRKTANDINTEPCEVCGKVMRYKADVPRHTRLHSADKTTLFYHCPVEGCPYKNLQKSNVNTHYNTHTGQKPHECPECSFATGDPGSLTRHKKKRHGYVPEKSAPKAKAVGTKASRRHAPYARAASQESLSTKSSSSSTEPFIDLSDILAPSSFSFSPAPSPMYGAFDPTGAFEFSESGFFSWTWDKFPELLSAPSSLFGDLEQDALLASQQIPRHITPAVDTGRQLEHANTPSTADESNMDWDHFDNFITQFQDTSAATPAPACATICPTDTYLNQPQISCAVQQSVVVDLDLPSQTSEFGWTSASQPCVSESLETEVNWDFMSQLSLSCSASPAYLSDSLSSFSSQSSPSSSPSTPSDYSFLDALTSELSTLDLAYPEPNFVC